MIGFPMNEYGSSLVSPQVVLILSLVQNLKPVSLQIRHWWSESSQNGITTSPKFDTASPRAFHCITGLEVNPQIFPGVLKGGRLPEGLDGGLEGLS